MSNPFVARAVIDLTERSSPRDVSLLYIGTASYDIAKFKKNQTAAFVDLGCDVTSLDVANQRPNHQDEMEEAVDNADIILVSGGNTLYALDRWRYLGLDEMLRTAAERGTVMAGGSAGAICWFDSGHSDSSDPETYRQYKLDKFKDVPKTEAGNSNNNPFVYYSGNTQEGDYKEWSYIKVEGLGIWPGMVCPHYDRIQSNGTPRMQDFDQMLEKFGRFELGLGIDHNAALEVDGDDFRVVSIPGEVGSVPASDNEDEEEEETPCVPGVWLKYVDEAGNVQKQVCPRRGSLLELLQKVNDPEKHILVDERVDLCRKENPLIRD